MDRVVGITASETESVTEKGQWEDVEQPELVTCLDLLIFHLLTAF